MREQKITSEKRHLQIRLIRLGFNREQKSKINLKCASKVSFDFRGAFYTSVSAFFEKRFLFAICGRHVVRFAVKLLYEQSAYVALCG